MSTISPLLAWENDTALRTDALLSMLMIALDLCFFFLRRATTLVLSLLAVLLSVLVDVASLAGGCVGGLINCSPVVASSSIGEVDVGTWRNLLPFDMNQGNVAYM